MIVEAKWCPRCQRLRPVEAFTPDASKSDGLQSRCRPCDNAKARAWYHERGGKLVVAARYRRKAAGSR